MTPKISHAQKVCELMGARQVVVIAFDSEGHCATVSYGETKRECAAVKSLCNAIADALEDGSLPVPLTSQI